jgi:hypothetical protein
VTVHQDSGANSARKDFERGKSAVGDLRSISNSFEHELGDSPVHLNIADHQNQRRISAD